MSKHHRELPNGGTLTYEIETDEEWIQDEIEGHIELGVQALRNITEARS